MVKDVTASFIIKEDHKARIEELARLYGVSQSVIMRNILERWDGKYILMPEKEKEE